MSEKMNLNALQCRKIVTQERYLLWTDKPAIETNIKNTLASSAMKDEQTVAKIPEREAEMD